MRYDNQVSFDGNRLRAFDLAIAALTALGFRVVQKGATTLALEGPGMTSTRQSPLTGASVIEIVAEGRRLGLQAELGGVRRMARFVLIFPIALGLLLGVLLLVVFSLTLRPGAGLPVVSLAVAGAVAPWLVLGPLMARWIRSRTTRALDALLDNLAAAGRDG